MWRMWWRRPQRLAMPWAVWYKKISWTLGFVGLCCWLAKLLQRWPELECCSTVRLACSYRHRGEYGTKLEGVTLRVLNPAVLPSSVLQCAS